MACLTYSYLFTVLIKEINSLYSPILSPWLILTFRLYKHALSLLLKSIEHYFPLSDITSDHCVLSSRNLIALQYLFSLLTYFLITSSHIVLHLLNTSFSFLSPIRKGKVFCNVITRSIRHCLGLKKLLWSMHIKLRLLDCSIVSILLEFWYSHIKFSIP